MPLRYVGDGYDAVNLRTYSPSGNGQGDDTSALQQALNALAARGGGTLYIPAGTYRITSELVYTGSGEAISIVGEQGGTLAGGGTTLRWDGANDGRLFQLRGVWRGRIQDIDFDGYSKAETVFWLRSNQPNGGVGTQGYHFIRCGFFDVRPSSPDPVTFRVGDPSGGTYQVDLTHFERCQFRGNYTNPQNVTIWKQQQGGNTCNFSFTGCSFYAGKYGIDAYAGSGTLSVDKCFFGSITDAVNGLTAACIRPSGAMRVEVSNSNCENNTGYLARFVDCGTMGSSNENGCVIAQCLTEMESCSDHVVVRYLGQLTLINNAFYGAQTNVSTVTPRIVGGPLRPGTEGSSGQPNGSIISLGNSYGYANLGDYAPLYDDSGNRLTDVAGYYGGQRTQCYSLGDNARKAGGNVAIPLEPWFGVVPNWAGTSDGVFSSTKKGLVPLSGGGTTNFLRADGTWAPAGGGASATTVEVSLSGYRGAFTITDAAISPTSKVLVWQHPGPYTGKGTLADNAELEPVKVVSVASGSGSAVVKWESEGGWVLVREEPQGNTVRSGAQTNAPAQDDPQARVFASRRGVVKGNVKFNYVVYS